MAKRVKVLVLMTSPLDKIVHALRVVESIKRRRPEIELTWVVRRVYEPLVSSFDFVDYTFVFRRKEPLLSFLQLAREIRRDSDYDYVLDFEGHARTGVLCLLARGKRKIGLGSAREGATVCYREVIPNSSTNDRHLVEQLSAFASVFGLSQAVGDRLPLPTVDSSLSKFVRVRNEPGKRICLFPGRYKQQRAWPGMLELAKRLVSERKQTEVVLLGVVPSVFKEQLPERVFDYQNKCTWSELCHILVDSSLVVANDNGPAQLAGALGCKNLTLYSYVSPERRGSYPQSSDHTSILLAPDGNMGRLPVEVVLSEVEKLLDA